MARATRLLASARVADMRPVANTYVSQRAVPQPEPRGGLISDHGELRAETLEWISRGKPESTTKTYLSAQSRFARFCGSRGWASYPAEPLHIAVYLRHLTEAGRAQSTIQVTLSALSAQYRFDRVNPTVDTLVLEARNTAIRASRPARQKRALSIALLDCVLATANQTSLVDIRDSLLILLSFVNFLRESEVVNLLADDVWRDTIVLEDNGRPANVLFTYIMKSKVDQTRRGHTCVAALDVGRHTAHDLGLLFDMYVMRRDKTRPCFFYRLGAHPGGQLAKNTPNLILRKWLMRVMQKADALLYGSHSLRSGGCSLAAKRNVELRLLMLHGRWKSTAVFTYMQYDHAERLSVSRRMFATESAVAAQ